MKNMKYVRLACNFPSFFICQKGIWYTIVIIVVRLKWTRYKCVFASAAQTLREDLQQFVKKPLAMLPLTKAAGSDDKATLGGLKTKEKWVGYDKKWMGPLKFL